MFLSSRTLPGKAVAPEQRQRVRGSGAWRRATAPRARTPRGSGGPAPRCRRPARAAAARAPPRTPAGRRDPAGSGPPRIARSRSVFVAATIRALEPQLLLPAEAGEGAVLDHAQDLLLEGERHVADLVEEQRAALRLLELARPALVGAGEGAALVAEQLALEQRLRERRAVDGEERARRPRPEASWIARATSSLPVPRSPTISTGRGMRATRSTRSSTSRIAGEEPTMR